MRGGDRVEITREMEVDVLHGHDLRVPTTRCPALHAEHRAEARFAQANDRLLADPVQRVPEPDGRRRLALARRRGTDRGDEDQPAVLARFQRVDVVERNLRLVVSVRLQGIFGDSEVSGDVDGTFEAGALGNLYDRVFCMKSRICSISG